MKVLNIITGLDKGGAENNLYKLNVEANDINFWNFSLSNLSHYGELLIKNNSNVIAFDLFKNPFQIISLIRAIYKIKPDVIQAWMYHSIFLTFFLKIFFFKTKFFWNLRATFEPKKHKLYNRIFIKISILFSYLVPQKIICCSDEVNKNFRELGYPKSKLVTINNGYDFQYLKFDNVLKKKIRLKYKLNNEPILFGMASRYNEQKDYPNLFKALNHLIKTKNIDFKFLLAGDGNIYSNKTLISLIKSFGLENYILLLGHMDIKDFFHLLDVHVLSSSHGEGFPNVVAESMLCNVLSIATNIGESKNIIGDFGWTVEPENPMDLYEAMIKSYNIFKNNHEDFLKITKLARKRIMNKYSIKLTLKNYYDVWKN